MALVETIEAVTAEDFLAVIAPRGPYFGDDDPRQWIFRGHSSDAYELLPSALRKDGLLADIEERELRTNDEQIRAESITLANFFERVDTGGLPIPEDSQELRRRIDELVHVGYSELRAMMKGEEMWPPNELLSLIAMAQHHGLPTRLLDWSRNPYKAAQFAAASAARRYIEPDDEKEDAAAERNLAVWAMSPSHLRANRRFSMSTEGVDDLVVVTAPRAGNPNLHAQEGVFTLYRPPSQGPTEEIDRRPLDQLIEDDSVWKSGPSRRPLLYRFVLPIRQASRLLYLVAKEGIDSGTLFPGYDGVVKALSERSLWGRDPLS